MHSTAGTVLSSASGFLCTSLLTAWTEQSSGRLLLQVYRGLWRGHHDVAIKQLTCFADDMLLAALVRTSAMSLAQGYPAAAVAKSFDIALQQFLAALQGAQS
jgi:hypothetical protein